MACWGARWLRHEAEGRWHHRPLDWDPPIRLGLRSANARQQFLDLSQRPAQTGKPPPGSLPASCSNSSEERRARFLVLGAGGLVGRHIRAALAGRDAIYTYRRDAPPGDVRLDITDAVATRRVIADTVPTVVVLAAADAYVERCEREPELTRRVNVGAAATVADSARAIGALLVVFSSEYVFDGTAGLYREADPRGPINEYGRQKVLLEDTALTTGRGLVCRTSAVFGNDPSRKNFVYQLVDKLRAGEAFDVPSDQLVTPTYAPSLAEAVIGLADRGLTGVFHVAGPEVMGRVQFARTITSAYGLDPALLRPRPTSELHLFARRPERCGLVTEKLRATLGRPLLDAQGALLTMPRLEDGEIVTSQGDV